MVARILGEAGFTLRSGGADGADMAFEEGCHQVNGSCRIYLPWSGFNKNTSPLCHTSSDAFTMASKVHPAWHKCRPAARRLHARNCHQVLGMDLATPSRFVVCWTPRGEKVGGTATAIRLAEMYNIPVFNMADDDDRNSLAQLMVQDTIRFMCNHVKETA